MFWTRPIDDVLGSLSRKVSAPLRLVLWDGREYKLSDAPGCTLRLKDRRAASALASPSLLSLAEAYISGAADLEGDIRDAIRSAEALARVRFSALFAGSDRARHSKREDREAIIGRVEMGYSYEELAEALGKPTADSARKAARRALVRLAEEMKSGTA